MLNTLSRRHADAGNAYADGRRANSATPHWSSTTTPAHGRATYAHIADETAPTRDEATNAISTPSTGLMCATMIDMFMSLFIDL